MDGTEGTATDVRQRASERFPFTKFLPPVLDARVVTDHLVARLDAAIWHQPVTVLVAPAGSGKTTAMAAWAASTTTDALWIRLDGDDEEPSVLAAALLEGGRRQLGADFGDRLEHLLAYAAAVPSTRQLVTSLVNDLGDHGPVTLLFDDVHAVSGPELSAFLNDLLDHQPPDVRVVLASRVQPTVSLARRRVRGEVAELALDDLRLDRDAVRRVLAHEAAVPDEQVDAVLAASGGWPAAVRLATAHVGADAAGMVANPPGVAADVLGDLRPFLANEVLAAVPEELQHFLLVTSILDELTPSVCDAVTGQQGSERILADLDRRNLFLTRHRGEAGDTWRTHDLFAAFLREELAARSDAATVRELHRQAAAALPPLRALPHLLAAGDHAAAAAMIVELGLKDLGGGMVLRLAPSIRALPPEVLEADHRLPLLLANVPLLTGDAHEAVRQVEPLRDHLLAMGDEAAAAEVNGTLVAAYLQLGDLDAAGVALEQALGHAGAEWQRATTLATGVWWCFYRNDWEGVSRFNEEALDLVFSSGDPGLYRAVGPALSPQLLFVDRGPSWLAAAAERVLAGVDDDDHLTMTALRPVLAGAASLRLEVTEAMTELRRCLAESLGHGRLAWTHQEAECLLMTLALGAGDLATVHRILDDACPHLDDPVYRQYRHLYTYAAVRAPWLAGDHRAVVASYDQLLAGQPASDQAEERVARAVAEAMVARIDGRTDEALAGLRVGEQAQREGRCWLWTGMPGLDRASTLLELGRTAAAIEAALPTLDTAAELGPGILYPEARANRAILERCQRAGVHTDLLRAVLAAADPGERPRQAVAVPGTDEVLSPRELEVLEQVATGASNREVAERLFISEPTVKSHLTRILRKLDASSRTHAVARCRELRLL